MQLQAPFARGAIGLCQGLSCCSIAVQVTLGRGKLLHIACDFAALEGCSDPLEPNAEATAYTPQKCVEC